MQPLLCGFIVSFSFITRFKINSNTFSNLINKLLGYPHDTRAKNVCACLLKMCSNFVFFSSSALQSDVEISLAQNCRLILETPEEKGFCLLHKILFFPRTPKLLFCSISSEITVAMLCAVCCYVVLQNFK